MCLNNYKSSIYQINQGVYREISLFILRLVFSSYKYEDTIDTNVTSATSATTATSATKLIHYFAATYY